ncbi:hypothetical protein ACWDVV_43930, partial [Streptomyces tendae]
MRVQSLTLVAASAALLAPTTFPDAPPPPRPDPSARILLPGAPDRTGALRARIQSLVTEALAKEGVAHTVQTASNMFSVFF